MSKNITIAEGTQAKNFNSVAKIRTNVIGGGTQNWIPEDEAGAYANLGEASIDENGTYRASDEGLDGFSKVTVNVPDSGGGEEPRLITKTIASNGTYNARDDGADGYSSVTVNIIPQHGRTVFSGISNAPVSQKIDTVSFLMDFSEKLYTVCEPHMETEDDKAYLEDTFRTGNWIKKNEHTKWLFDANSNNNDIVFLAYGGLYTGPAIYPAVVAYIMAIGIGNQTGEVTIRGISNSGCTVDLSVDNKFVVEKPIEYYLRGRSASGGSVTDQFLVFKEQLYRNPRYVGPTTSIVSKKFEWEKIDSTINTGIVTNLTGGTIT